MKLPTFKEAAQRVKEGDANPLHHFIYEYDQANFGDTKFRGLLQNVINYVSETKKRHLENNYPPLSKKIGITAQN